MLSIIASVGKNNEIGKNGDLCFYIKDDIKFFRNTTAGHKVIMGLNTWKSLPKKLENRKNIVLAEDDVPEADQTIKDLDSFIKVHQNSDEEVFVIGGGSVYAQFLPYCRHLYLTEVDASDPDADTFFPKFDKSTYSKTIIKKGTENGLSYSIVKYNKI
jgi:dihydrofolate reductase